MESLLEKPASPKLEEYYNIIKNTFAFSPFCSICKKHPICWTLASVERQRPGCCERKSLFPGASGWLTLQRCMPVNAQTVICIYREKHIFTKTKFFFGIISYSQKIYLSFNVLKKSNQFKMQIIGRPASDIYYFCCWCWCWCWCWCSAD